MTTKESVPLPCPFCGESMPEPYEHQGWSVTQCGNCGACGPYSGGRDSRATERVDVERVRAVIARDICEADRADPDDAQTVCISVSDLDEILARHLAAAIGDKT